MFFLTNLKKGGVLELNILMLLAISMRFFAVHVDIFFKDSKKNHTSSAEYGTDFSLSLSHSRSFSTLCSHAKLLPCLSSRAGW